MDTTSKKDVLRNIQFNGNVAICPQCETPYTTDFINIGPTIKGGSVKVIVPFIVALGQALRNLDQLVGQSNHKTFYQTCIPNTKLRDRYDILILCKEKEYQTTQEKPSGLFGWFPIKEIITQKKFDIFCLIYVENGTVFFVVEEEKYLHEVKELAEKIAPQFNCNIKVTIRYEL